MPIVPIVSIVPIVPIKRNKKNKIQKTNNMNTTIKEQDGALVAQLEGRLDTAATPQTEKDMQPLFNSDGKDIILDCTQLEYISSSGLRLFLNVLKDAKAKGNHVYVSGMNANIRSVFTMTGFLNLFEVK